MSGKTMGDALVGLFVLFPNECGCRWAGHQGHVEARVDDRYLVTWFSWLDGCATNKSLVTLDQLGDAKFFNDEECWGYAGDRMTCDWQIGVPDDGHRVELVDFDKDTEQA